MICDLDVEILKALSHNTMLSPHICIPFFGVTENSIYFFTFCFSLTLLNVSGRASINQKQAPSLSTHGCLGLPTQVGFSPCSNLLRSKIVLAAVEIIPQ